jgi:hypothetical protein
LAGAMLIISRSFENLIVMTVRGGISSGNGAAGGAFYYI